MLPRFKFKIIVIAIILIFIPKVKAEENIVNIYLFHSDGCSHCKEEIQLLNKIENKYQNVNIHKYEISKNSTKEIIEIVKEIYGVEIKGTPTTIIGNEVYTGYSHEKSPTKFIATIEYFGKYYYEDKLAERINNIKLPNKEQKEANITLKEYIKENSQYKLLFNIKSDTFDTETTSTFLGVKSSLNIFNIIILIIVSILLIKKTDIKDKIIIISIYLLSQIIFKVLNIININIIASILTLLIILNIIILLTKRKDKIIIYNLIVLMGIIPILIEMHSHTNNIFLLKRIQELNILSNINIFFNISIYLLAYFFINIIILLVVNKIISKIKLVVTK